jgi:hypothetical protein
MEQFLLFAMLYERMSENAARGVRHMAREAQPLEPILWHRMDDLKAGRRSCAEEEHALDDARCRDWTTRQPLVCGSRA